MTIDDYLKQLYNFLVSMGYVDSLFLGDTKVTFFKKRDSTNMEYEIWFNLVEKPQEKLESIKLELFYKNKTNDSVRLKKSVLYDPTEETFDYLLNKTLERIIRDFERVYSEL